MLTNRHFFRNYGLTMVLVTLFLVSWVGQWLTGWCHYNDEALLHHQVSVSAWAYLGTGDFWEATGENWESEFLQMGLFIILTSMLYQKGSPESNDPDHPRSARAVSSASPWPTRVGGMWLSLYRHSLSGIFMLLFSASIIVHAIGGWHEQRRDARAHAQIEPSLAGYVGSSRFWFESLQNWQSEFLSLAAMVYLAVYLRSAGSAESKDVATPHAEHE